MHRALIASSYFITLADTGAFERIAVLTMSSTLRISSGVIALSCEKSKRVRSASTSEPRCCTCLPSTPRSAACIRCVAE